MLKVAVSVLFSILAFGAGLWFFLPGPSSEVASNPTSQPAAETPAPSSTAPSPPAETPATSSKPKPSTPPSTPEKLSHAVDVNPHLTWDNFLQIHDGMS